MSVPVSAGGTDPRVSVALEAWRAAFCEYEPNGMAPDEYVLIAKILAALDAFYDLPETRERMERGAWKAYWAEKKPNNWASALIDGALGAVRVGGET